MNPDCQPKRVSKSGAPVYIHKKENTSEKVADATESIELINKHIQKCFPNSEVNVWHEEISEFVHIDVHWIKANKDRKYHILLTSGMSSLPMAAPIEYPDAQYAELAILLPKNWKLSQDDFSDENNYWPIRVLKSLARFPHQYKTWLWEGHTIDNGNPPREMATKAKFTGTLLFSSFTLPDNFKTIETSNKTIDIFSLFPLYAEELQYKLDNGVEKLLEKFDQFNIEEIIDLKRKNTCK